MAVILKNNCASKYAMNDENNFTSVDGINLEKLVLTKSLWSQRNKDDSSAQESVIQQSLIVMFAIFCNNIVTFFHALAYI